jgi:hypothetical protein
LSDKELKGEFEMKRKLLFLPLILAAIGVLAAVVMLLWNWVTPALFPAALQIDYWHALGLLVLCRILFGGFKGRHGGGHERWHRWQTMTDEEREQFRQKFMGRCRPNGE